MKEQVNSTGECSCVKCKTYSTWPVHLLPAVHQRRSLLQADLAVLQQLDQVGFVVLRSMVRGAIQWISNLHFLQLFQLRVWKGVER